MTYANKRNIKLTDSEYNEMIALKNAINELSTSRGSRKNGRV
jgi:hypothetical protein